MCCKLVQEKKADEKILVEEHFPEHSYRQLQVLKDLQRLLSNKSKHDAYID